MKKTFSLSSLFTLMTLAVAVTSCNGNTDKRPVLAVSIEPQRYILEQLAGDRFRIITVMPSSADPEAFDPPMSIRADIDRARSYFTVGQLPFEGTISLSAGDSVHIVSSFEGVRPTYGTHGHVHSKFLGQHVDSSAFADPHYWASVKNMRVMARNMTRELQSIDPANAAEYNSRLLSLDTRLDSLDRSITERFAANPPKPFVVWHPTLSYFARDYGLEQIAVSDDNKEVSVGALRKVIDEAVSDSARIFFSQGYATPQQAQTITKGINGRRVDINLTDYDWETQIKKVVDELLRL